MKAVVLALACMLLTMPAMGKDGSSGCGPGWYVLKKNSLVSSVGRLITNGILLPISTLGMTFGTSNCSKHSIVQADKRSLHIAENTLPLLKQDIARGHGTYLNAYIDTFNCNFQIGPKIGIELRKSMSQLNSSNSAFEFVSKSQSIINGIPGSYEGCRV